MRGVRAEASYSSTSPCTPAASVFFSQRCIGTTSATGPMTRRRQDFAAVRLDLRDERIEVFDLHADVMNARRRAGKIGFIGVRRLIVNQRQVHITVGQVMRNVIAVFALTTHRIHVLVAEHVLVERAFLLDVLDLECNVLDEIRHAFSPLM
jgi:hypothetical protein